MKAVKYFLIIVLALIVTACKKKTDIEIKLYNPYLDEYVKGATIAIIERKGNAGGGLFSGNATCKEVATSVTDENGIAMFDNTKLKTRDGYVYYPVLKEAWGITKNYSCGGYNGNFIKKGVVNSIIKSDRTDGGNLSMQYNNLFSPAILGDSLYAFALKLSGYDPELGRILEGSGGIAGVQAYDPLLSYPSTILSNNTKINGRFEVYIRKKKNGVVTVFTDTIKSYPNQTTIIQVDW